MPETPSETFRVELQGRFLIYRSQFDKLVHRGACGSRLWAVKMVLGVVFSASLVYVFLFYRRGGQPGFGMKTLEVGAVLTTKQ